MLAILLTAASCADGQDPLPMDARLALLEDGQITLAEMLQAAGDFSGCVQDELGGQVTVLLDQETGDVRYFAFDSAGRGVGDIDATRFPRCWTAHLEGVTRMRAAFVERVGGFSRAFYEGVAQCLRDQGIVVPDADSDTMSKVLGENERIYLNCYHELSSLLSS